MSHDRSNPSDKYGALPRQSRVVAIVVDDRDPEEAGRVKCRILGEQDDESRVPDDKLAWYNCTSSGSPQLRGHGSFPPQYTVGSRVILENIDQQGYYISSAAPNTLTDKEYEDRHTESTKTTPQKMYGQPGVPVHYTLFNGSKHWQDLERTTKEALGLANKKTTTKRPNTDNKKKDIGSDPTKPEHLDQEPVQWLDDNLNPQTIGTLKESLASATNPQKYITDTLGAQKGVLIPNSLDILESLKKTASSGSRPTAINSIGGAGNFLGAIQGILSFLKSKSKNKKKKDEMIDALYLLYKQETGLDALDANGDETPEYQVWEAAYYLRDINTETATS